MPERAEYYTFFAGGLDLVTPSVRVTPGVLRESQNFEIDINGGYKTIVGYERFDGRPFPSAGQYAILNVTITGSFSVADIITGLTSGATATVLDVVVSGAQDYLVITKIVGTFSASEDLQVSSVTEGNTDAVSIVSGASTLKLGAEYTNLAADEYRQDILAVPGSGNILGVWTLSDDVYAFRNNTGATAADLYRSSTSGWTLVALGRELAFTSGGVTEIKEGDTITGATSGATAVTTRVMLESGSFAAGTAAGKFIFASQTGTFQAENINVGVSTNLATIAGDGAAITLDINGRYDFVTHNFGGQLTSVRMYGCDGVNRGFEFDGTVFCPISTGMVADKPTHCIVFENHLFFSFFASAQHSGTGLPYAFTLLTGAAELVVGDDITGFVEQPGAEGDAALAVFSKDRIHILYGTSSADWQLINFRSEVGAYAFSIQELGITLMLDSRGVSRLSSVQAFGNFQHDQVSALIQPFVNERKTKINASCIVRNKSQYRLFFSDKYALYITVQNNKILGLMPVLMTNEVKACCSHEDSTGNEIMFFGSSNGFVYQFDKGTSFDGEAIESSFCSHFMHFNSIRRKKAFKDISLEITGDGYSEFQISTSIGYGVTSVSQQKAILAITNLSSGRWDDGQWDVGFWDSRSLEPHSFTLEGSGENIAIDIRTTSDFFAPLLFSGALIHYLKRRQLRNN